MARLVLMFNKQVVKEYSLQKESVTIGRNEDNTIQINNLAVSGYHARIDAAGNDHILTDLQSTNGTFINDKRVVSHKLSHGDNIIVGKHVILFVGAGAEAGEDKSAGPKTDLDRTMMLDTAKQKELLSKQKEGAQAADMPTKIGVISFIEGAEGEVELKKKLTKIGKADTSEVQLAGLFMPATAATISRRPSGYVITTMGGKIKVNGEPLKDSTALKDFDTVEIGKVKFQFYQREIADK